MKEQFEHIVKDKLQDFSMRAEPGDWTRIERSLGLETPKRVPLYRYVATAAAVLLLAIGGFYFLNTSEISMSDGPLTGQTSPPKTNPIQHVEQSIDQTDEALEAVRRLKEEIDRSNGRGTTTQVAYNSPQPGTTNNDPEHGATGSDNTKGPERTAATEQNNANQSPGRSSGAGQGQQRTQQTYTPPGNRLVRNRNSRNTSHANWALALFADGSGGGNSKGPGGKSPYTILSTDPAGFSSENSSAALTSYSYDTKTGLLIGETANWDHHMPLTLGLSMRKELSRNWGLEFGISYSYLSSSAKISGAKAKQQLHYLGIPVGLTYTPFRLDNFDLYARLGAAADFNIAGRQQRDYSGGSSKTHRFTTSGVQWSASANIGIMYNLTPKLGLYLEPGISHYFEYSNQPSSYWQEHPTNFNLKIGVRTTF